ncbi:unnamed protein product [Phytomonas sp. EM1]|nr:unnamed protein product [Phytomonas sp. EM1]|eukprot:CCW60062.1 unnamed protein product [Phytomonas sp. isolate EM1]
MNTYSVMSQTPHIGCVETLGYPNDDVAQSYMEHITQRISLILPRRGWYIGTLKEFYPRQPTLLGLNFQRGVEISIRLRVPGNRQTFLPFHEVVCTALHELAHCQEDKHHRPFWSLYYELLRECEALEATMVLQGRVLYPEHIMCSTEGIIAKDAGNALKKEGANGPRKRKPKPVEYSTIRTCNSTPLLVNPDKTRSFCGVGYRLGGSQLPTESKPKAEFLAAIIQSRLRIHDTHFASPENVAVRCDLELSPKDYLVDMYDSCSLSYTFCGSWRNNTTNECESSGKYAIVGIDEGEDPPNIYEEQETHVLKHRKLEISEENIDYTARGVRESGVGLRASSPITID